MRKVTVDLTVRLKLNVDEGVEVSEIIDELEYDFNSTHDNATVEDTEITDYEVVDSK
jgi:hypothetical protein